MTNKHRTALITGAGRGIGKAIALQLASEGYLTLLVSRTEDELKQVVKEIDDMGMVALYFVCDVSNQYAVAETINDVMKEIDRIDVLVNCAGRSGGGKTSEMDDELWNDIIAVNLNSVYYVTKYVLKQGNMDNNSSIINIASTGGKQGVSNGAAYSASKGGVISFTKALGKELAETNTGITVNAVCPGYTESDMARRVRQNYSKLLNIPESEVKKKFESKIPLGRYIEPEEVAGMVSYLTSDQARGITIQAFNICGGLGIF